MKTVLIGAALAAVVGVGMGVQSRAFVGDVVADQSGPRIETHLAAYSPEPVEPMLTTVSYTATTAPEQSATLRPAFIADSLDRARAAAPVVVLDMNAPEAASFDPAAAPDGYDPDTAALEAAPPARWDEAHTQTPTPVVLAAVDDLLSAR